MLRIPITGNRQYGVNSRHPSLKYLVALSPVIISALFIGAIELLLYIQFKPPFLERIPWLLHDPYKGEHFDRILVYEKLRDFDNYDPDIIMVGDSSGLFSIQPKIVMGYLEGLKFLNLSTGANNGYEGYRAIAEFMLRRNQSIKYVVLNVYPQLLPSRRLHRMAQLGSVLHKNLRSHENLLSPPSAYWMSEFKSLFFLHQRQPPTNVLSDHKVALEAGVTLKDLLGYIPEHDIRKPRNAVDGEFYPVEKAGEITDLVRDTIQFERLSGFANTCRKYGVQLILTFNPMGWQSFQKSPEFIQNVLEIERFQRSYPEVWITNIIDLWEPVKVAGQPHIAREYTHMSSMRLGKLLAKLLFGPQPYKAFNSRDVMAEFENYCGPPTATITPLNESATKAQKDAALAFLNFTATGESKFRQLLSKRVLESLESDKAFSYMIWDTKTRLTALGWEGISFEYDFENLDASLVSATNIQRCVPADDRHVWIKLHGSATYGIVFGSGFRAEQAVKWPSKSEICVPIVLEDDRWKFDGYCEEMEFGDDIQFKMYPPMLGLDMIEIPQQHYGGLSSSNSVENRFEISSCEVTQLLWFRIMGYNPSLFQNMDNPVDNVNLREVEEFLRKINSITEGPEFRLPYEDEWILACSDVQSPLSESAWFLANSSGSTHKVAQKDLNSFGLYDMLGNVWEIVNCRDSNLHAIRGGGYNFGPQDVSPTARYDYSPEYRASHIGFRLARDLD